MRRLAHPSGMYARGVNVPDFKGTIAIDYALDPEAVESAWRLAGWDGIDQLAMLVSLACVKCRATENTVVYVPTAVTCRERQMCQNCVFWLEKKLKAEGAGVFVIDREYYSLGEAPTRRSWRDKSGLGFGGRQWMIRDHAGVITVTNNLWFGGRVAPAWDDDLPDSAYWLSGYKFDRTDAYGVPMNGRFASTQAFLDAGAERV